jgi:hypothetical protein
MKTSVSTQSTRFKSNVLRLALTSPLSRDVIDLTCLRSLDLANYYGHPRWAEIPSRSSSEVDLAGIFVVLVSGIRSNYYVHSGA